MSNSRLHVCDQPYDYGHLETSNGVRTAWWFDRYYYSVVTWSTSFHLEIPFKSSARGPPEVVPDRERKALSGSIAFLLIYLPISARKARGLRVTWNTWKGEGRMHHSLSFRTPLWFVPFYCCGLLMSFTKGAERALLKVGGVWHLDTLGRGVWVFSVQC